MEKEINLKEITQIFLILFAKITENKNTANYNKSDLASLSCLTGKPLQMVQAAVEDFESIGIIKVLNTGEIVLSEKGA